MALRLAHIYLPKDSSGFLDDLTEKFNIIEHYEIEEKNRNEVKLLLDAKMTEPVLDFIENRYGHQHGFRVIVTPVEAVIPRLEVEEKPETDEENQKSESEAKRIYREELYEDINSVSSGGRTFILLVILSACVAAIGYGSLSLLQDSTLAAARRLATRTEDRLDGAAQRLALLDPARLLARGWSITRRADSGALVTDPGQVEPGRQARRLTHLEVLDEEGRHDLHVDRGYRPLRRWLDGG